MGKLEVAVAVEPEVAYAPIDVRVEQFDPHATVDAVRKAVKVAEDFLEDGEVQQARTLLSGLASENNIVVTSLPLKGYDEGIKAVVKLVNESKFEEAKEALYELLSTIVITRHIIPLPILRAEVLLKKAEKLTETEGRTKEQNKEMTALLDKTVTQLEMGEALGCGGTKERLVGRYEKFEEMISLVDFSFHEAYCQRCPGNANSYDYNENTGCSNLMTETIDTSIWLQHRWRNRLQSIVILFVMASFLALLGMLLWGSDGIWLMLMIGAVSVMLGPAVSPHWVMRLYGARKLSPQEAPELYAIIHELASCAGIGHVPEIYYLPSKMLNAFAVGNRNRSAIAVTDGLLRHLTRRELRGVIAHEISHVRNSDLFVMGLADTFSRATRMLSLAGQFLLVINLPLILLSGATISWPAIFLLVFAPTLSDLAQLALSRTREFDADLGAAWLTEDPEGLASALRKIEKVQGGWLKRVFLPGRGIPEPSMLRTHPKTEERVARLLSLKKHFKRPTLKIPDEVAPWAVNLTSPVERPPKWHVTSGLWY